ncbi:MAG: cation transporting ATPase C-terminal domain-containing protein [Bacteroidetes bacterium]|nr:cation transporting ATPase C-terminal domain-containing protein [Bacteroidota bacterium]
MIWFIFTNKPLIISMLISLVLSLGVIYIGILQTAFQTVGLLASELVIAFSAASTILIIVELWKRIRAIIIVSEKR